MSEIDCVGGARNAGRLPSQRGFTLIELMIVVVILGIITTIAVQQFSGSAQDGERARIISELNSLNDAMGRYYQGNYSYANASLPTLLSSNAITPSKTYTVSLTLLPTAATAQSYYLTASPLASGIMKGTGLYSVNEKNQRCHFTSDTANPATDGCPAVW